MPVNMRWRFPCASRITTDRGIDNRDGDIGISKTPVAKVPPREIQDPHTPDLHDRLQRPFPDFDPVRVQAWPEIRIKLAESVLLFFDGKRGNRHYSPKKVLRGVARAAAGAATAAPSAGTLPICGR
jgi:hypothetical protein